MSKLAEKSYEVFRSLVSFSNRNTAREFSLEKYLLKSVRSFVHNILRAGSPRSGKTLLARALPGILPEMSIDESLDVTRIYSVADQLPAGTPLIKHRPLRVYRAVIIKIIRYEYLEGY